MKEGRNQLTKRSNLYSDDTQRIVTRLYPLPLSSTERVSTLQLTHLVLWHNFGVLFYPSILLLVMEGCCFQHKI